MEQFEFERVEDKSATSDYPETALICGVIVPPASAADELSN